MNVQNKIKLLIHSEYLIFEWAKKTVNAFHHYALKNKMDMVTAFQPEKLMPKSGETVVVIGVDQVWLEGMIEKLKSLGVHIIVIHGEPRTDIENVSYARVDQRPLMRRSLEYLSSCGKRNTAFFGVQKNDTSDRVKELFFRRYFPSESVYPLSDSVDEAFAAFYRDAGRYDSVICSNDIIAYCFLRRCREVGLRVPGDLYLVGNGDLWMSSHMKPSLTTATYDWNGMIDAVMSCIKNMIGLASVASLEINLEAALVARESTGQSFLPPRGDEEVKQTLPTVLYDHRRLIPDTDPEIQMLHGLNQTLFCASQVQREILGRLAAHESYEKIAAALVMSVEAVKYHSKKLYRLLGVHSKTELTRMIKTYNVYVN